MAAHQVDRSKTLVPTFTDDTWGIKFAWTIFLSGHGTLDVAFSSSDELVMSARCSAEAPMFISGPVNEIRQ